MTEKESQNPHTTDGQETFGIDALDKLLEEGVLKGYARMDLALSAASVFIVVGWGMFVFFRVADIPFLHEDFANIVQNEALHRVATISEGWNGDSIRPLTALSLAIDWKLGEGRSGAFHIMSVAIHVLNAALVFLLCRRLYGHRQVSEVLCLAPALLFLVHPASVATALYVSDRGVLLGTFFALLSSLCYLGPAPTDPQARHEKTLFGACLAFSAGFAAHEGLWALPLVLILADLALLQRVRWGRIAPIAFLAAAFIVVQVSTADAAGHPLALLGGVWDRAAALPATLAGGVFAPGPPLPIFEAASGLAPRILISAGTLIALIIVVVSENTVGLAVGGSVLLARSLFAFAIAWTIAMSAAEGLFVGRDETLPLAGPYLAMAGLFTAMPAVLRRARPGAFRTGLGLALASGLIALSVSGFAASIRWKDEESLLLSSRGVCPDCNAIDDRLAALYIDRARAHAVVARSVPGSSESMENSEASSDAYRNAIPVLERNLERAVDPHQWILLGEARQQTGNPVGALEAYERARREDPWSAEAAARLAGCLLDGAGPNPPRGTILRAVDLYAVGQASGELSEMDAARFAGLLTRIGDFEAAAEVLDAAVKRTGADFLRDLQSKNAQSIAALTARETRLESLTGREKAYEEANLLSLRGQLLQSNYRISAFLKQQGFDEPMWILLAMNKSSMGPLDDFLTEFRDSAGVPAVAWANLRSAFAASGETAAAARISIERN